MFADETCQLNKGVPLQTSYADQSTSSAIHQKSNQLSQGLSQQWS